MKLFGSLSELLQIKFRKNGFLVTTRPNQATTYTADRDAQIPPGDVDSILVGEANTQTLTNKTLTSPSITTPTGITKADVGLSNVDNTSDATKNAAAVTLTNKTLTAPVINSPTGITKADVGLGNVDNTSDATKNAAAVTLTNKTLTAPVQSSYEDFTEIASPAAPSAGFLRLYTKTDDKLYSKNSANVETQITPGTASSDVTGNVRTTEGAGTTTLTSADNRWQTFDLSASRIVKLPTTGVGQGDVWIMTSANAFTLNIQASDASSITKINGAKAVLQALVSTPVSSTDWKLLSCSPTYDTQEISYTATFAAGSAIATQQFSWHREGEHLCIKYAFSLSGTGSNSNPLSFSIPSIGVIIDSGTYSIAGSFANVGGSAFFQSPRFYPGYTGFNDATSLNIWSGYSGGNTGGNEAREYLNNDGGAGNIHDGYARVRITEWIAA